MSNVNLVHGTPLMIDYTPSSAVTAGDVVVSNDLVLVAHKSIAANELGAMAAAGGVYDLPKETGTGKTFALGAKVYWDDTNNRGTSTATGNKQFGICTKAAGASDSTVRVAHRLN